MTPSRVLIVDDGPTNLEILGEVLRSKGYTVDTASNGAQAIENNILLHERAQELSRRDSLTGLLNHATFQLEMDVLFNTAVRYNRDLCGLIPDPRMIPAERGERPLLRAA